MDFTEMFYLKASRRYIVGKYHPPFKDRFWFGFATFEDAIKWLRENGFKILPTIHKKKRKFPSHKSKKSSGEKP